MIIINKSRTLNYATLNGGELDDFGTVNNLVVKGGGKLVVEDDGVANHTVLISGAIDVAKGGHDKHALIFNGTELVEKGGTSTDAILTRSAKLPADGPGVFGATQDVFGTAVHTSIGFGRQIVEAGGVSLGALVGDIANYPTVLNPHLEPATSAALAGGFTAVETVRDGGKAVSTTLTQGGVLDAESGSILGGNVQFHGSGYLLLKDHVNFVDLHGKQAAGPSLVLDAHSTAKVDLANLKYVEGHSSFELLNGRSGYSLVVHEGDASETFALSSGGHLAIKLSADSHSGDTLLKISNG